MNGVPMHGLAASSAASPGLDRRRALARLAGVLDGLFLTTSSKRSLALYTSGASCTLGDPSTHMSCLLASSTASPGLDRRRGRTSWRSPGASLASSGLTRRSRSRKEQRVVHGDALNVRARLATLSTASSGLDGTAGVLTCTPSLVSLRWLTRLALLLSGAPRAA